MWTKHTDITNNKAYYVKRDRPTSLGTHCAIRRRIRTGSGRRATRWVLVDWTQQDCYVLGRYRTLREAKSAVLEVPRGMLGGLPD